MSALVPVGKGMVEALMSTFMCAEDSVRLFLSLTILPLSTDFLGRRSVSSLGEYEYVEVMSMLNFSLAFSIANEFNGSRHRSGTWKFSELSLPLTVPRQMDMFTIIGLYEPSFFVKQLFNMNLVCPESIIMFALLTATSGALIRDSMLLP